MSLWMVRAGKYGEQEATLIENNIVAIGWNKLPDLFNIKSKENLKTIYKNTYPDRSKNLMNSQINQIWRYINEIKVNDIVSLPLKTKNSILFGIIQGDYQYKQFAENVKHTRKVKWLKEISRTEIDQDLLYSFGALLTVCQIKRNDAEKRIKQLLGLEGKGPKTKEEEEEEIDIETYAQDQITKFVNRKFKGHGLARLVDAVLQAQGYTTKVSPPGPDGGVDILASGGLLGFDEPRICIQVKSTENPADVRVLRELRGVMSQVKAEQCLLVSWSGFNSNVLKEAKNEFFIIRLWDSKDLLQAIFKYYEKFDDELKAELPLKRMWALVLEEE
jgi:restriction system protein